MSRESEDAPPSPGGVRGSERSPEDRQDLSSQTSTININDGLVQRCSVSNEAPQGESNLSEMPQKLSHILTRPSYPGFADIVEMEAVQRLSKSHMYPSDLIELVKSHDLSKFYEAKQKVEEEQPSSGKSEFAQLPLEEVMNKFGLEDVEQGLSEPQVIFNRNLYGENILDLGKKDPIWKIFLAQFKSFVILLLFIAAIASLALRNYVEGVFIIFIVTVNAIMATYMERSAANVLEKLAQLSSPVARVVRNGVEVEVASKEVVPGDILVLKTGDTVVADVRLFEVMEMRINESLLTGESVDVKKNTFCEDMSSPFSTNLSFASTSVVSGFGKGVVINTGMNTQVGKIAKQLKKASETSKITPLQKGLNRLGGTIGIISTLVLITIVIIAVFTGFDDPTRPNTNRTLSIVLLAVGFAASSIPEGLPMVVTISLSLGAKDMAKENANVLKLPSVETLGCCSIICSDKTGTLTEGKMVTTDLVIFYKKTDEGGARGGSGSKGRSVASLFGSRADDALTARVKTRSLKFYPTYGFNPRGGLFYDEELDQQMKDKLLALFKKKEFDFATVKENLMSLGAGAKDGVSRTVAATSAEEAGGLVKALRNLKVSDEDRELESKMARLSMVLCSLNSYSTRLVFDQEVNRWACVGNMTESALVVAAAKCKVPDAVAEEYPRLDRLEVPFNSKRKLAVTVHQLKLKDQFEELDLGHGNYTHVALVKGAPDVLRRYCKYLVNTEQSRLFFDHNAQLPPLNPEETREGDVGEGAQVLAPPEVDQVMRLNDELSNASLRVIMLGLVPLTEADISTLNDMEDSEHRQEYVLTGSKEVGSEAQGRMLLLGITGSFDPPRPGVKGAIDTCRTAGIRVIMITGDQKATAVAIAKQIGLGRPPSTATTNRGSRSCRRSTRSRSRSSSVERAASDLSHEVEGLECSHLHVNNNPVLDYLPDEEIDAITERYSVFCRAQPEDKVAIVTSLKRKGEITAMTGDGVNDAAALKTADIGISMGLNGTDVAKGASELVLLDDNFCTIVHAVRAGRTIYSNIQKFVSFLLGTNIGEILYLTTSILIRTLPPVEALQILFLNFLTDGCPAVALSREPADKDAMKKPPRRPQTPIMTRDWWLFGNLPHTLFEALAVIAAILLGLYLCTGVITLKDLHAQCRYVKLNNSGGSKQDLVYFCKSYEYVLTRNYTGWVTNLNYYDPFDKEMRVFWGACKGRVERVTPQDERLHPKLRAKFEGFTLEKLAQSDPEMAKWVELDEHGWVRSKESQVAGDVIYGAGKMGYVEIVGRKSKQGRTISFITAVWSEMLRAYTVRSWDYFYEVFNRNPWMHVACSVSATVTFALTVIPGVSTILRVVSLTYWQYLLSIALAMTTLVLDECISKVLYHRLRRSEFRNSN